jgi:thiosulfate/3-mercaptopyruvate sulfurtransferase
MLPSPLCRAQELLARLQDDSLRIVDASWYLPSAGRDAHAEYLVGHIPGAVFTDLDAVSDPSSGLPHMLPTPSAFARVVGALGIGNRHEIVVYDASGVNLSAARMWWTFRVFGHSRVRVLDGGLVRWKALDHPLESGAAVHPRAAFVAQRHDVMVRNLTDMQSLPPETQVLDARSRERFEGTAPEPRSGVRSGHSPGSRNLPYTDLVRPDGTLRPPGELRSLLSGAGIDAARPVVTSCGSGVSACAVTLALEVAGFPGHAVYDGSWAEWGSRIETPVEQGPPA